MIGPRDELQVVLGRVQDLGLVQLVEPAKTDSVSLLAFTPKQERHVRSVRRVVEDVDAALRVLGETSGSPNAVEGLTLPRAALIAGRSRRVLEALAEERQQLEEERALILKFRPFFSTFRKIIESGLDLEGIRIFYLVLREDGARELRQMRAVLRETLGDGFELLSQPAESSESAMLLVVPKADAATAEQLLSDAGVQALSFPDPFQEESVGATIQRMQARLEDLPEELARIERDRRRRPAGTRGRENYALPGREIEVELEHKQIWGISVPTVVSHSPIQRTLTARGTAAPSVGLAAGQTANEFERLIELVLEALPKEQLVRRLGDALAKATRQVNTLQLRVEPTLTAELHALRGMFEERERDERSRLRHVLRRRKNAS
jgi:vacuolar-type H+-ATPase subunit D/Vma8